MEDINKVIIEFKNKNYKAALEHLEKIINKHPSSAENLNLKGILLQTLSKYREARECWIKAIKVNPKFSDAYYNLGNQSFSEKKYDSAENYYRKAINYNSNNFSYYFNLGRLFINTKKYKIALECFLNAKNLNNNFAPIYYNIGFILNKLEKKIESIKYFEKSIEINNRYLDAYYALGINYRELKKFNKAKEYFTKAIKINKNYDYLRGALMSVSNSLCDWTNYNENLNNIKDHILNRKKSITPWMILSIFDSMKIQNKSVALFIGENKKTFLPILKKKEKINIGYFSANFCEHAVSNQIKEVFELHNKDKFNLYGFYFGNKKDDTLKKIKKNFNKFYDISQDEDDKIIKISKKLEIDIAVDLMGFTNSNRFTIFKKRCAPIQISFLGYPGTTGLANMDYVIADKHTIQDYYKKYFSEKIIYMPNSYMPNNSKQLISKTFYKKSDLGISEDTFIYCCFNKHYKITPLMFNLWMDILKEVKNSVLWLNSAENDTKENLYNYAKKDGVNKRRIIFTERSKKYEDYLAKHKLADIFLDTSPYSAQSTGCSSLIADVPIITKLGKTFAANVAGSLLKSLNLEELIAKNEEEYKKIAIELAINKNKFQKLKKKLKENKKSKTLFNSKNYVDNLEKGLEQVYEKKRKKLPNQDIYIE